MPAHRSASRAPSLRLRAGRWLGGAFGIVGVLCVPAAYFALIARDPRCRSLPMFLLLLLFFPCLGGLIGLLTGVLGAMAVELTRHHRPPRNP
jgi:hypothetical protein